MKIKTLHLIVGLLLLGWGLTQCKQDGPQPKSTSDVLLEQPDLSIFRTALAHAGLTDALKTGTFTIFAPSDEGFKASGYADGAAITSQSPQSVRLMLRNHIVNENLPKANMKLGIGYPTSMMSGTRLYLTNIDEGIFLNEAKATTQNLEASNGTIYVINRVLPIPTRYIAQVLRNTPNFSLFRSALQRAAVSDVNLVPFLTDSTGMSEQPYTVFVPTNAAMEAAGYNAARITATSPALLARLVGYHIARGRYFTTLMPKPNLQMFDATFSVTVEDKPTGLVLRGRANPTTGANSNPATITQPNLLVYNGLVHTIDRVLIPQ